MSMTIFWVGKMFNEIGGIIGIRRLLEKKKDQFLQVKKFMKRVNLKQIIID